MADLLQAQREGSTDVWSFDSCEHQPGPCYPGAGSLGGFGYVTSAPGFPHGAAFGVLGKPGLLRYSQLGWTSLEALRAWSFFPSALFPQELSQGGLGRLEHVWDSTEKKREGDVKVLQPLSLAWLFAVRPVGLLGLQVCLSRHRVINHASHSCLQHQGNPSSPAPPFS